MSVPTNPQNSISVCESRPLRARRDASIASTAPTRPSQIVASSRSKPGTRDAATGAAEVVVDDIDVTPAKLLGAIDEAVLAPSALMIMRELVCCRLPDVDAGAAGEMLSRDLGHRRSPRLPLLPAPPRWTRVRRSTSSPDKQDRSFFGEGYDARVMAPTYPLYEPYRAR